MGPAVQGGMGEAPLSYQDLRAWEDISGIELLPWEARLLRSLSTEYVIERQKGEEQSRPAPYSGGLDDVIAARERVGKQVDAAFGRLKGKRG